MEPKLAINGAQQTAATGLETQAATSGFQSATLMMSKQEYLRSSLIRYVILEAPKNRERWILFTKNSSTLVPGRVYENSAHV